MTPKTEERILGDLFALIPISLVVLLGMMISETINRPKPTHVDMLLDIGTLNSATIVQACNIGSETWLTLSDGRQIIVRGYKGHHFYERRAVTESESK